MSEIIKTIRGPLSLPAPRVPLLIRPAVPGDLPFMDKLQKMHTKMVGWMPTKQLEEKIGAGHVMIADAEVGSCELRVESEEGTKDPASFPPSLSTPNSQLSTLYPVGYVIGRDQYFKRDDVGIIYQMNVVPGCQRNLVGATLLKAMFARAAYGCRLFCCWCAQDIGANKFWEAMGFVPLAFRAGSREKGRVRIFWQKRIRNGDTTTPWWFPSQTGAGAMNESRIVLPIPPGRHWSDVMPVLLPQVSVVSGPLSVVEKKKRLPGSSPATRNSKRATTHSISAGGLRFAAPPAPPTEDPPPPPSPKPGRSRRKNDPKLIAAARELRDRWLEEINGPGANLLTEGKYEVGRDAEPARSETMTAELPLLPAA